MHSIDEAPEGIKRFFFFKTPIFKMSTFSYYKVCPRLNSPLLKDKYC